GEWKADTIAKGQGFELGKDKPQRLDGAQPSRHPAIGDETDRLGAPLAIGLVNQMLQWGRKAVIVLRRHHDKAVCRLYSAAKVEHGCIWTFGIVQRQGEMGYIDDVEIECAE